MSLTIGTGPFGEAAAGDFGAGVRIDARESSRHVRVLVDGEVLADSHHPRLLFETGLPTRYYLPPADVRSESLLSSDTTTRCA